MTEVISMINFYYKYYQQLLTSVQHVRAQTICICTLHIYCILYVYTEIIHFLKRGVHPFLSGKIELLSKHGFGGRDGGRYFPNSPSQQNQSSLRPGICYNQHKDSGRPSAPWCQKRACRTGEKENLRWDTGQVRVAKAEASARGTPFFQSLGHCAVLAVRVDPWPPAAQPSGCGTSAKGLPGLLTHRDEGGPFCTPRSHLRFQATARPRSQSPVRPLATHPAASGQKLKRRFHCPLPASWTNQSLRHPGGPPPSHFQFVKETEVLFLKGGTGDLIPGELEREHILE